MTPPSPFIKLRFMSWNETARFQERNRATEVVG